MKKKKILLKSIIKVFFKKFKILFENNFYKEMWGMLIRFKRYKKGNEKNFNLVEEGLKDKQNKIKILMNEISKINLEKQLPKKKSTKNSGFNFSLLFFKNIIYN